MRRPTSVPRTDSIRPSVLLLALLVLGSAAALVAWIADDASDHAGLALLGLAPASDDDDDHIADRGSDHDHGGRRIVLADEAPDRRVSDPGAQGSVREAWARAFEEHVDPMPRADPQMEAFRRSFQAEEPLPFRPALQRGELASATGLDLPPGARCDVRVLPVSADRFNCVIRVTCAGRVVYPNQEETAGYVACDITESSATFAADEMGTVADGDPAVTFDAASGRVTVSELDAQGRPVFEVAINLEPRTLFLM